MICLSLYLIYLSNFNAGRIEYLEERIEDLKFHYDHSDLNRLPPKLKKTCENIVITEKLLKDFKSTMWEIAFFPILFGYTVAFCRTVYCIKTNAMAQGYLGVCLIDGIICAYPVMFICGSFLKAAADNNIYQITKELNEIQTVVHIPNHPNFIESSIWTFLFMFEVFFWVQTTDLIRMPSYLL